jgi:hypothetical protein
MLKHFVLTFQEKNTRVPRIIINDDKNIPLVAHGANLRGTDSVHIEQMSGLLSHYGINRRIESSYHLAVMIRSTNKVTLKLEQGQSSEWT